jgi:hypothetical protein
MNVKIGTQAVLFPEKESINGISLQCSYHMDAATGGFYHYSSNPKAFSVVLMEYMGK